MKSFFINLCFAISIFSNWDLLYKILICVSSKKLLFREFWNAESLRDGFFLMLLINKVNSNIHLNLEFLHHNRETISRNSTVFWRYQCNLYINAFFFNSLLFARKSFIIHTIYKDFTILLGVWKHCINLAFVFNEQYTRKKFFDISAMPTPWFSKQEGSKNVIWT